MWASVVCLAHDSLHPDAHVSGISFEEMRTFLSRGGLMRGRVSATVDWESLMPSPIDVVISWPNARPIRQSGSAYPIAASTESGLATAVSGTRVRCGQRAAERIDLPRDLAASLRELGRLEACPLFVPLLAALQVLLGRLAGTDDVVAAVDCGWPDRRDGESGFLADHNRAHQSLE
jgi:hypothetical protein